MTLRRLLGLAMLISGTALAGAALLHYGRGIEAQKEARRTFEKVLEARRASPLLPAIPAGRPFPRGADRDGEPIAWLLIPSVRIDAIVLAGSDPQTLAKGPGHVPGTELPGRRTGINNCVITAHRDADFRNLGLVRKGERIELTTPEGVESYRVVSREIVDPSDVAVLAPTQTPRLTLITCYPFRFIGHAPKRLVVVAEPLAAGS